MADIQIFTTGICPYCVAAKNFLTARGLPYRERRIDQDAEALKTMRERTSRTSVPQIFVNDTHVGGFDDMVAMDRAGKFAALLEPLA
jgi:glutaredoxin 3